MDACLLSSEDQTFQTPPEFLELVRKVGWIGLDPFTAENNPTGAMYYCTEGTTPDGWTCDWTRVLEKAWGEDVRAARPVCFTNPEYGRKLGRFAKKVVQEACNGAQIITLTPSRTDTRWWHELAGAASSGLFWKGRLTFYDAATGKPCETWNKKKECWEVTPAPFPCFVGYFGRQVDLFNEVFGPYGRLLG